MNKKTIAILLALTIPLTVAAFPGDNGGFKGHRANKIERLTQKLDLTAEQKPKVEALFKEQEDKFKAIFEETHSRLQEILTKEQMAKMDEMKKQHDEKWQKNHAELKDQKSPEQTK
ncbi:MAG: hypothetical protein PHR16_04565 [Methylovulum sp.]|nr:hypothetical protein [Methylovulum sp.]